MYAVDFYNMLAETHLTADDVITACRAYIAGKMPGINAIAAERDRQIRVEGFDSEHDKFYTRNQLVRAAVAYALPNDLTIPINSVSLIIHRSKIFPTDWKPSWFKLTPDDRLKELAKAGALIAAEYDRIINSKK